MSSVTTIEHIWDKPIEELTMEEFKETVHRAYNLGYVLTVSKQLDTFVVQYLHERCITKKPYKISIRRVRDVPYADIIEVFNKLEERNPRVRLFMACVAYTGISIKKLVYAQIKDLRYGGLFFEGTFYPLRYFFYEELLTHVEGFSPECYIFGYDTKEKRPYWKSLRRELDKVNTIPHFSPAHIQEIIFKESPHLKSHPLNGTFSL